MRYLGILLLIYSAYVFDLRADWSSLSGLRPVMLDVALLAVCAAERSAFAVLCGAAVGCLSAFVMGTQPGLGVVAASTAAFLSAVYSPKGERRGQLAFVRFALPLAVVSCVRGMELSWLTSEKTIEPIWWRLAGNGLLTLIVFLATAKLVQLVRRPMPGSDF